MLKQHFDKNAIINFLKDLDINVNTHTKARGHQGFYFKNRIDISKTLDDEKAIRVLVHEFAHYIHDSVENNIYGKEGGNISVIFDLKTDFYNEMLEEELKKVTKIVDSNSRMTTLLGFKKQINDGIKSLQEKIQIYYPNFLRSKKFKEFDKYIKYSNAKYLLKYDRVTIISGFFAHPKMVLDIDKLAQDFSDMPPAFANYIKLRSLQRKQTRVARRINKLKKYYERPTELFARFVEGIVFEQEKTKKVAPFATQRFFTLLNIGYYLELSDFLNLLNVND